MRASDTTYCGFWVTLIPNFRVLGNRGPKSGAEPAERRPILSGKQCTTVHTGRMPLSSRKGVAAMATANIQAARPVKSAASNSTSNSPPPSGSTAGSRSTPTFCPTDVADLFDTVAVGSPLRRHQGRERRSALRADQLRSPVVLERSSPPTSSAASTSTAKSARPSASTASASSSTASPARSPTGAWKTATSPRPRTASGSTATSPGSACTSTARSTRPSGSTSACTTSTASPAPSATGAGTPQTRDVVQPENPYEYPARLGLLHPARRRQHGRHHGARPQRGHALQVRLAAPAPTSRRSARTARSSPAAASPRGPLSFMRVYDQIAAVVKSGGKTRRAAKMQSLKVWHPDVMEFIECKWKEEQKARVPHREGRLRGQLQRRSLQLDHVPEREPLGPRHRRLHAGRREGRRLDHALGHRRRAATAPTYPAREVAQPHGRVRLALRRPRRAVRHDDQQLAHLPQQRPHQRQQSVQRVHVPRRHGLQPGEHQPDEVPPAGRHVRRRAVPGRLPGLLHRPGNPGRSRQLSDAGHRPQQPPVPAAGPGLLEPRQPADGRRHCRTTRDAGRGVCGAITALLHGAANLTSAELAEAVGPFDGFEKNREPMLRVMQMHRDAVEEINADVPGVPRRRRPRTCGTKCSPPAACTASATPRRRCSPPPARSAS